MHIQLEESQRRIYASNYLCWRTRRDVASMTPYSFSALIVYSQMSSVDIDTTVILYTPESRLDSIRCFNDGWISMPRNKKARYSRASLLIICAYCAVEQLTTSIPRDFGCWLAGDFCFKDDILTRSTGDNRSWSAYEFRLTTGGRFGGRRNFIR